MAYKADCAVVLALLYYTLQLCQTATQHSEASFFDGRTDELDPVNKLKERTRLGGTILSAKQLIQVDWRGNFRTSRIPLYKLADELRVNPATCVRPNSI